MSDLSLITSHNDARLPVLPEFLRLGQRFQHTHVSGVNSAPQDRRAKREARTAKTLARIAHQV